MICKRTLFNDKANFQTRAEDGKRYIEGYFAVFDSKYWLWEDAYETIDRGAFDLVRDNDVRALTNHDTTLVLGRTTAGTLTLKIDDVGLWGSIEINDNDQDAVNQWERVQRGDVSQCSFGFDILSEATNRIDGQPTEFRLMSVKLYEVSVCTFPAYEETGVTARKAAIEEANKRKIQNWREEMKNKLKGV